MSTSVTQTQVKDNPSVPVAVQLTYLPDQLVYDLKFAATSNVLVSDTSVLKRGTVLGMITEGGSGLVAATVAASGNHGNGVLSGISFGEGARKGNYVVHFTGATTYVVVDPNNEYLAPTGAGSFGPKSGVTEISFTFSAGTHAMVSGDEIIIVATASSTSTYWRTCKATVTDGSQVPRAILADDCDPTSGAVNAPVYVSGEFNGNALIYDASWTLAEISSLFPANIIIKTPLTASDAT